LDEAREAMRRVVRDGNRASEVITRIRALMTNGEPSRAPVDLNELIRETLALTQHELSRRHITLLTTLAPDLPHVSADRVQLQQVLLNLVMNALDSLGSVENRERILQVRTSQRDPGLVVVAVEDNGVGFAPGGTERLFEAFYTTKAQGLGMGLALSRSIVEAHGGHLEAIRNAGFGVTFQFILPLQREA
ncbi:MAG TPA: ATP-binding protein, partial [Chthoniobacteraceae bacterium]|nr:ATP-binding protein [Chthoniobacteraceae bacterium]